MEEAEKNFNNIKIIFTDDGITKADEKILDICIIPFQKKGGNLENELKTLSELFKYKGKTDHIYKGILLFSKRGFIFDTAIAIKIFLDKI